MVLSLRASNAEQSYVALYSEALYSTPLSFYIQYYLTSIQNVLHMAAPPLVTSFLKMRCP